MLLVALALIAAAVALIYIEPRYGGTYILALLALLGTIGVAALFGLASGILHLASRSQGNPLLKAVVDGASTASWSPTSRAACSTPTPPIST